MCILFGFSIACFVALRSVITVELLGLEKLNSGFGLVLLLQGLATLMGSPFAGWLYDISGSYDAAFYVAGAFFILSGAMGMPLKRIARWERDRAAARDAAAAAAAVADSYPTITRL